MNLEAAITFLETVDLASLRSDEPLSGPSKSESRPTTPHKESRPQWISRASTTSSMPSTPTVTSEQPPPAYSSASPGNMKSTEAPIPSHQRKLSNLFQPPASALGAASDVVRTTADQGFKTIGNTLDNSFRRKHLSWVIVSFISGLSLRDVIEESDTACYSNQS